MAIETVVDSRARGRVIAYLILSAALLSLAVWLHGSPFRGQAQGHTVLETVAALLALFVGLVAIIHYYTGHSARYLFIGSGFLGAALLDGYHALITGAWFPLLWPSLPQTLIPWSWYSSRLLLAILFLVLWRRDAGHDEEEATAPRAREQWAVYVPVALMTLASFALIVFVNLPAAYVDAGLLGRPQELVIAALFVLALAGFLHGGRWRSTVLDHTLILFLIMSVATQAFFMAFARSNHDVMFAAAHAAKIGSYGMVLVGVLYNMHGVLWQAREDARALQIHARELEKHVAQRTAELHETAESFRHLFAANPHPMWVFDTETLAFLEVNDAAVAHYGYSRQAFLHMRITDIRPAEDVPRLLQTVSEERPALSKGRPWRHRLRDGRVIDVEIASHALTFEGRPARLVIAQDITERVQNQQEIERLNAQLEERVRRRTEQLEATNKELEAFAYSVSHDLRAPLRAMDGFARILLSESTGELSESAHRYLERIRHNAQQMDQLIQDLLAFSRLNRQQLRREPVQPERLVQEALANLEEEMAGRQLDVVVQPLPQVQADPTLLRVVFANLLANALKYTRTREPARVVVGVEQPATEEADSSQSRETIFFVRDNGVGFDMKYADKLFGVFQRLHRSEEYEGTGVGLATVQRIVRRHGGRVWVDAAVDQGTTIYFTLEEA